MNLRWDKRETIMEGRKRLPYNYSVLVERYFLQYEVFLPRIESNSPESVWKDIPGGPPNGFSDN